jgi:lipid II:glycine glycyltransferase (peptidoglycan interpeptide bridge formation enzyme)
MPLTNATADVSTVEGLEPLDPVHDRRWRDFVERHPSSSVFHTPEWLIALQQTYGYEPVAFTDPGAADAVRNALVFCRVNSTMTGRRFVSLPFSDHCEPLVADPGRLSSMLESLKELGNREGRYIEIKPVRATAIPSGYRPTQEFYWHWIDLRPDLDTIFSRLHRSHTRRAVRKAARMGVSVDVGCSESLIRDFYTMHRMTRRRHDAPTQPLSWFRNLAAAFGDRMRIYRASYAGHPVASILTLRHRQTLVYKYGCSDIAYKKLGATPALFWRAIVDAKADGCVEMDLGRSDTDHHGLIAFKEHLGGRRETLTYYRHTGSAPDFRISGCMAALQRVISCAPASVQFKAGNRLYKHFG